MFPTHSISETYLESWCLWVPPEWWILRVPLGASWLPLGCLLGVSWVPPGCSLRAFRFSPPECPGSFHSDSRNLQMHPSIIHALAFSAVLCPALLCHLILLSLLRLPGADLDPLSAALSCFVVLCWTLSSTLFLFCSVLLCSALFCSFVDIPRSRLVPHSIDSILPR